MSDEEDPDWLWLRGRAAPRSPARSPILTLEDAIDPHGLYEERRSAFQFPMPVTWAFGAGPGVERWSFLDRDDKHADELRRTKSGQGDLFGADRDDGAADR